MVLVSVLHGEPAFDVHAERCPKKHGLDVVHGQRVAREQNLDEAQLDQTGQVNPAPVWTTAGPATTRIRPPASRTWRISSAMPAMRTFFGFSAETSLPMKLKISVCRERSSGVTRTPPCPTTTSIPGSASWNTMHHARPAWRSTAIAASISIFSTRTHRPLRRTSVGRLLVE